MHTIIRSHFTSAVLGGMIVAGGFLALGLTGRRVTETIIEQAPVAETARAGSGLTPHDIYQRDAPGVVFVRARLVEAVPSPFKVFHEQGSSTSTGSGFLVDRRGDILTAYHVVAGAERSGGVTIGFEGGVTREANVVAVQRQADLAVLKVNLAGLTNVRPLALGDSTTVRVGDPTLTIGNPFGVDRTLTSGIVSSLQHQIPSADGLSVNNVIQTDQLVDPSSSGSPLLDAAGRVVGVNSQLANVAGNGMALSFATPIDTASGMLARVRHQDAVQLAYIGLHGVSTSVGHPAVAVTVAVRGGPAAQAGLRAGDAIEKLDGQTISSMTQLETLVIARNPGQVVSLEIRRAGRIRQQKVVLGSRTGPEPRR